MEVHTVN